jgi:endonuclease/exonuclease/phosphatase family metal-dependent hydrolase
MLAGDFNSVRFPHERNSFHGCTNEALFNDTIRDMAIQELSILNRSFTWSNMQSPPVHNKLDRIFTNALWDEFWLDSSLLSLLRITSDHYPLKLVVSTNIPRPIVFRYYNA